jgi:putative transposase
LFTREIVGWAMDSHMRQSLVHDAIKRAKFRNGFCEKRSANGLMFHSDKGSQYAAHATREHLQTMGYRQSMSGTGNCFDNAPMESFWHTLKVEETHGRGFETRDEAKRCVFAYIEGFYNTTRMDSSLGWRSPRAFRRAYEQSTLAKHNEADFSGTLSTGRIEVVAL